MSSPFVYAIQARMVGLGSESRAGRSAMASGPILGRRSEGERSIDAPKDVAVHVTDGLGAASELLGGAAALVESAQVQAGVSEASSAGIAARAKPAEHNGALRDRARLLEVAPIDRARRGRREQHGSSRVIIGHQRDRELRPPQRLVDEAPVRVEVDGGRQPPGSAGSCSRAH